MKTIRLSGVCVGVLVISIVTVAMVILRSSGKGHVSPQSRSNTAFRQDPNILSEARIVLIVAYMRTGSTLTGSILQEYPGSFYVFEPLRYLTDKANHNKTVTYIDNKDDRSGVRRYRLMTITSPDLLHICCHHRTACFLDGVGGSVGDGWDRCLSFSVLIRYEPTNRYLLLNAENVTEEMKAAMSSWMDCDLYSIDQVSLLDKHHGIFNDTLDDFLQCSNRSLVVYDRDGEPMLRYNNSARLCLPRAVSLCTKAKVRVYKTIRLPIQRAMELLPLFPNMKIVHLVRDPRGALDSTVRVNLLKTKIKHPAHTLCSRIRQDLLYSELVRDTYPDRLMLLQYEDLAEFPIDVSERLYDFLELPFIDQIRSYVQHMTSSNQGDSCRYCTQRKNSSKTANAWRHHITKVQLKTINTECRDVYQLLGYQFFDEYADVKDTSIPIRIKTDVFENIRKWKRTYTMREHQ